MVAIPQLTFIGVATLVYDLVNYRTPTTTPRGVGFFNNFIDGNVTIVNGPTIPIYNEATIAKIDAGELPNVSTTTMDLISGGDYFYYHASLKPGFLEQNCHLIVKNKNNQITKIDATGSIKVTPNVLKIINRDPDASSIAFGDMDFWQPIQFESGVPELNYINQLVVVGQGSLEVEGGKGRVVRLRLFTPSNGNKK